MKLYRLLLVTFPLLAQCARRDLCPAGSEEIDGNWYCQAVDAIRYTNVGAPGAYDNIIDMPAHGTCSTERYEFSGPISPLNEEISLHFRGPISLKQFAVYIPNAATKRGNSYLGRRIAHLHQHKQVQKQAYYEKRQMVTAVIESTIVSWKNDWFGPSTTQSPNGDPLQVQMVTATIDGKVVSWPNNWSGTPVSADPLAFTAIVHDTVSTTVSTKVLATPAAVIDSTVSASSAPGSTPNVNALNQNPAIGSGIYERIGYYDSVSQTLSGLVFLNNHGGDKSGVFDLTYGASLSYASSDATCGTDAPQILNNMVIPSGNEITIMSDQLCENNDCGFVRPGSVAYHGFDGADKVFLFEFSMPMDGKTGFQGDMPSIWALNAKIPRTVQYGECSCWETGCGEFDITETLNSGSMFLKSILHAAERGGDSDYLERPISGTMKLAVVFSSATSVIHIQVLPNYTNFTSTLTEAGIDAFCSPAGSERMSLFNITP